MSEELARDPSSRIFLPLGEELRRRGDHELALRVALRGLERHPHDADAHDLLGRIAAATGQLERAMDEWSMALSIAPAHTGALKGLGFVSCQMGRLDDAERWLASAVEAGGDAGVAAALDAVRAELAPTAPEAPVLPDALGAARRLFDGLVSAEGGEGALVVDRDGFAVAGRHVVAGVDVGEFLAAHLTGVSDEAARAVRHLGLGGWTTIVVETSTATVALAPTSEDAVVVVAAPVGSPGGYVRRLLARARIRAAGWLGAEAA